MASKRVVKLKREDKESGNNNLMNLAIRLGMNVVALLVVEYLVPGFTFRNIQAAFIAAIVIGIINTYLRPVVQLLALPFTLITFGIAAFLINVALLWLAALIVPGFEIANLPTAAIASILITLVSWFLHKLARD